MVVEPDIGDDLERLAQGDRGLRVERARVMHGFEPADRARDGDPVREGEEAGEVCDRDHAALLHIGRSLERPAAAERRLEVRRHPRETPDQIRILLRVAEHCHERRRHVERAADLAKVERHVRPDEVRAVGRLETFAEGGEPAAGRHAPKRIARDDVVRVELESAAREAAARRPRRAMRSTPSTSSSVSSYASAFSTSEPSVNSRRAALPSTSHAHAVGAGPRRAIDSSMSRRVIESTWSESTLPMSSGAMPAPSSDEEELP